MVNSDSGRPTQIWDDQQPNQIWDSQQSTQIRDSQQPNQIWTVNSQVRSGQSTVNSDLKKSTVNSALTKSTQIWRRKFRFGDVNSEMSAATKKEHESTQVALEASHTTIVGIEIGLCMSKKIERMKAKKQQTRDSHQECHNKWQARIQAVEDTIQDQHLIIEALVEEKASLLQTIQGLQEDNGAPAPFDDEWEEEPEEEGLEDISIGEGDIVDE
ncbi:14-3-3-like protein D-like [Dorcoceras hygrometricum]|uniref:14-3-3-like protein D-like n=1 Tax=Dorcoceras hygrometricum TaxID=472368 RepID=A0A2Z7BSX1_9LAMI|nr:14-3-3-like protein D-like [Dorcoceras hygrometricum]